MKSTRSLKEKVNNEQKENVESNNNKKAIPCCCLSTTQLCSQPNIRQTTRRLIQKSLVVSLDSRKYTSNRDSQQRRNIAGFFSMNKFNIFSIFSEMSLREQYPAIYFKSKLRVDSWLMGWINLIFELKCPNTYRTENPTLILIKFFFFFKSTTDSDVGCCSSSCLHSRASAKTV